MPRFMDVAAPTGFGTRDVAGGTIADDFDGDGLRGRDPDERRSLLRSRATSTTRATARSRTWTKPPGSIGQFGAINAVQTDYNNDGHLDIFMLRGGWEFPIRNSLLRNNGDGTFTDVTRASGPRAPATRDAFRRLGRLRQRRLARRLRRARAAAGTAVPQSWRRHVRGRHREIGHQGARPASPRAWSSATTTTTATPISTCRTSSARTCCTTTTGTARSPRSASSSESRSRSSASRRGSSTTTTTAGSTSSSRRTRTRSRSS